MSKIYDLTISYRLLRRYINFAFGRFYSKVIVLGKENIPAEGPVIFGPNHQNALMDALLLLKTTPWKLSNTFIARGDIFKKGFLTKVLRYLKILPAFRMRDGFENLGKNDTTFEEAREVLETKNALCIMPEGNQGNQRKLQLLVKGIFRIAFPAQEIIGDKEDIKLIPVGIDYSDRARFGQEVIVNYGSPISVNEYMPLYKENPVLGINQLRNKLREGMHAQMVDLATEKHYDCFETAMEISNSKVSKLLYNKNDSISRFYTRQQIAEYLIKMEAEAPEKTTKLDGICAEYRKLKTETKLTVATLENPLNFVSFLFQSILLLVTLPVFVLGFVLNMFPFLLPGIIRKKMGIKYDGFFSSFDFVLGALFTFPIFYLIQTILFAIFVATTWWMVPIFAVSQYLFGEMAVFWAKPAKKYANKVRYIWLKMTNRKIIEKIQQLRENINMQIY